MEPSRFDDLTKALATSTSRRHALKTIVATALGGLLGLGGIGTALANCKPNGIGCNIGSQCCSGGCCHGTCTDLSTTSNCGKCGHACSSGQGCCGGTCTDLNTTSNCGSCGHACASGQICQNGQCVSVTCTQASTCSTLVSCPMNASCLCATTSEGTIACTGSSDMYYVCQTSTDCSAGQVCIPSFCNPTAKVCVPLCS